MANTLNDMLWYYDGSMNVEFSAEISENSASDQTKQEEPCDIEQCRHLLGANPF
jgi:hypothetical protein